jgi:hypothetical protein
MERCRIRPAQNLGLRFEKRRVGPGLAGVGAIDCSGQKREAERKNYSSRSKRTVGIVISLHENASRMGKH